VSSIDYVFKIEQLKVVIPNSRKIEKLTKINAKKDLIG